MRRLTTTTPAWALPWLLAGLARVNTTPAGPPNCPATYPRRYRIGRLGGVKAAVWYPTASAESVFAYSRDISSTLA